LSKAWLVVLGWWIFRYSEVRTVQCGHLLDVTRTKTNETDIGSIPVASSRGAARCLTGKVPEADMEEMTWCLNLFLRNVEMKSR
jgi:hypothetical protein